MGENHIRWAPMFTEPNAAKRGKKREGRGCLAWQPSKQQGLPHTVEVVHGSGFISDWRSRGEEKEQGKKGLPVWEGDHNGSVLRGELISLET